MAPLTEESFLADAEYPSPGSQILLYRRHAPIAGITAGLAARLSIVHHLQVAIKRSVIGIESPQLIRISKHKDLA